MTNQLPASSVGPATTGDWLTATNLVIIAIGALLALLVILWGARLKRQRKAVDTAMEDLAEGRADETHPVTLVTASLDDIAPSAPETDPLPVAPAPPPLADTPVVATAPEDISLADDADDLTRMKGVGPKLAARLGELGVTRFAQIAALSPAEAETIDARLGGFQGRLARDRWIEQAGYLAKDDRAGFEAAFGRL